MTLSCDQVLSQLRHPHIVAFLGACLSPPNVYIIEELVEGGSLYEYLHRKDRRGEKANEPLTLNQVSESHRGLA